MLVFTDNFIDPFDRFSSVFGASNHVSARHLNTKVVIFVEVGEASRVIRRLGEL